MQELNTYPRNTIDISVLIKAGGDQQLFTDAEHLHSFTSPKDIDISQAHNIFVIVNALELNEIAEFVRRANNSKRLRALLIRQDANQNWITQLLEKAHLRTLRNTVVHSGWDVPRRIVQAWQHGVQDVLIADAALMDDCLFVLDCALNRYEVRFDQIKALSAIPKADRDKFAISEEGSHISWARHDVDIDIDTVRAALDPSWNKKARLKKLTHDRRFGVAIAMLRHKENLRQNQIAGLTDRQVRRIEAGDHATLKSLELLAAAHRMNLNQYLNEIARYVQDVSTPTESKPDD